MSTDSRFDNNVIYRLTSANRTGSLPASTKLNTNPINPKIYFSLMGTAANPTFTMRTMPDINGPFNKIVDPGMAWFFRYPAANSGSNVPKNYWTIHNSITGEKVCLERADTKTGQLKMAPLVKGKASQLWYIELTPDTGKDSTWDIQDSPSDSNGVKGAPGPTKLDVLTGSDNVVARVIKGSPIDPKTSKPYVESTTWDVQPVRGIENKEDIGVGFPS
jgi:hypothetical protein